MLSVLWYHQKKAAVEEASPVKNTRLLALVILLVAFVAVVYRFWDVVMLFFLSAIIAYLLSPIVNLLTFGKRVPRGIAVAVTALLHLWRRSTLLSILAGTAVYMVLVQVVFA